MRTGQHEPGDPPATASTEPVTAVVATRDRPASLRRCLAALAADREAGLEIVVVDDGSQRRDEVAEIVDGFPGTRLLRLPGRGPAAARNLGATAARGEVILLCDDDCEPQPGWAPALAAATLEAGTAAGLTVAPDGARAPVAASQALTSELTRLSLDPASGRLRFAPTCNLGLTAEAWERVPFDESYPDAAGEDRDWSARAFAAGLGPRYVPEAVAVHRQRLGVRGFLAQQHRYGRGAARYRRGGPGRGYGTPRFYLSLLRAGFAGGLAPGALALAAQGAVAAGALVGRLSDRPGRN